MVMFHSYVSLPECMFQLVKSDGMENFHQPCWLHWRSEVMLRHSVWSGYVEEAGKLARKLAHVVYSVITKGFQKKDWLQTGKYNAGDARDHCKSGTNKDACIDLEGTPFRSTCKCETTCCPSCAVFCKCPGIHRTDDTVIADKYSHRSHVQNCLLALTSQTKFRLTIWPIRRTTYIKLLKACTRTINCGPGRGGPGMFCKDLDSHESLNQKTNDIIWTMTICSTLYGQLVHAFLGGVSYAVEVWESGSECRKSKESAWRHDGIIAKLEIHAVDGCEILHHQKDNRVIETLSIMGCLPPINSCRISSIHRT